MTYVEDVMRRTAVALQESSAREYDWARYEYDDYLAAVRGDSKAWEREMYGTVQERALLAAEHSELSREHYENLREELSAPKSLSQRMAEKGFTRRPTWRSLPKDE